MNLKNIIRKMIKSKTFLIIVIIIVLIIVYIVVEKNFSKIDSNIENWDKEVIADNGTNEIIDTKENNKMKKEVVLETEENKEAEKISQDEDQSELKEISDESIKKDIEKNKNVKIYVYITGEVNNPGVIILPYGSRISDAIDYAGGVTSNADIMKVNLVYLLQDGMKVNIPSSKELKNNPNFEYITMGSGDEKNDANNAKDSLLPNNKNETTNESAFKISNVNINTATQTELETLPGIGPSLALKIINYRKENGKFTSIEELKNVSGIGDNKYEEIKKYIYV